MSLINPEINAKKQPIYEVIKREDLIGAFKAALASLQDAILSSIEELTVLYSATANTSLWVWGYTSRFDYDLWW